jgi:hypothetical protein
MPVNPTDWSELDELETIAKATRRPWVPDATDPKEHWYTEPTVGGKAVSIYEFNNPSTESTHPVVDILTKDGEVVSISCSRTVLREEMEGVEVGDMVLVQYLGQVEREGRRAYHRYRVLRRGHQIATADEEPPPAQDESPW